MAIHLPFKARKIFSKRNSALAIATIAAVHAASAGSGRSEDKARLKQALVAMTIAIVQFLHIAIYMPSGVSWLFLTIIQIGNWDQRSSGMKNVYNAVSVISNLFLAFTAIGHCISFIVYLVYFDIRACLQIYLK